MSTTLGCVRTEAATSAAWEVYDYLTTQQTITLPLERENQFRIILSAAGCAKMDIVNNLLTTYNLDPREISLDNATLLSCAAYNGNLEAIKQIVEYNWGSLRDPLPENGRPLLHELVESRHSRLLSAVRDLDTELSLDKRDLLGNTILHAAAKSGDWTAFCELRDYLVKSHIMMQKNQCVWI